MIGYATNESPEMLPMTLVLATRLALELKEAKNTGVLPWLRPDAKTQVTMLYEKTKDGEVKPVRVETVLISTQHNEDVTQEEIYK